MRLFSVPFSIMLFTFLTNFSFGQNFKVNVKMLDSSNASIKAGLFITQIDKAKFEQLVVKVKNQNLFAVDNEFFAEKNSASVSLKSNSRLTLKDFELFLKQIEVYTVVYQNQEISSQDIALKYSYYKSDEIKKFDRVK